MILLWLAYCCQSYRVMVLFLLGVLCSIFGLFIEFIILVLFVIKFVSCNFICHPFFYCLFIKKQLAFRLCEKQCRNPMGVIYVPQSDSH